MFILILDDADLNNLLMTEAVRGIEGCIPRVFTRPADALAFVAEHAADIAVAITDYDMPEQNGVEFTRAARAVPAFAHVPVVMVTSMDQRKLRREALEAGATDFLGKPFDAIEIKARVSNLVALNTARRQQQDRAAWLAREVAKAVALVEAREREIVIRLARAAEHRDNDTGDHITRVATYSGIIARHAGLSQDICNRLSLASTMHDIGKIGVPDAVLLKEGPLTPQERELITRHAAAGYAILEGSGSDVVQLAAEVAITHHERWDGAGYPRGLAGEAIPISGRIVAVADVFDALVSDRPYKRRWAPEAAKDYVTQNAGTQFCPSCVEAFLAGWVEIEAFRTAETMAQAA